MFVGRRVFGNHFCEDGNLNGNRWIVLGSRGPGTEPRHPSIPYMREVGAMWQIGVLTGKPCTFLVQNGSFSAFLHLAHRNRSDFCDLRLRCPSQTPEIARFRRQEKAMLHCDLRVRWTVASDLRFRAAIAKPKTPSFCGISGDLAQSTRKSLAIAIVRFWCAKFLHCKNKERLSRGLDVKWHIPATSLDASRSDFSAGIYSINRAFEWLWPETQGTGTNLGVFVPIWPVMRMPGLWPAI